VAVHLIRAEGLHPTAYVASADQGDLPDVCQLVRAAFGAHDAPSTLLGVAVCKGGTECLHT